MKMFINYFQNAKTDMVNRVIKDETLKSAAHDYIKAQTNFAHMLIDNTECMMKYTFDNMAKGSTNDK